MYLSEGIQCHDLSSQTTLKIIVKIEHMKSFLSDVQRHRVQTVLTTTIPTSTVILVADRLGFTL